MAKYNPQEIEPKWQRYWQEQKFFEAEDFSKKPKLYLLVEFPYPSAEGLHVGHCRSYTAMDIIARKKRMEGFNVLFPMGWDAFGLPTENYAIKTGVHPKIVTAKNTVNFKKQLRSLGLSFDWSREINTTDPKYYKWTQWIFIQLFKKGLAYKAKIPVNYCPACKITLANEEVIDNKCERCGEPVIQKEREQWLLKITKYADRLIDDLDKVDFPDKIKTQQINWIGRKEWIDISYPVIGSKKIIIVSTTRPDTNFGATFVVLAPEHLLFNSEANIPKDKRKAVYDYIKKAKSKSERERIDEKRKKTGVFTGLYCLNQLNNKKMPIYVADFVLTTVGTGAVVGVPGHDKRDFEFAKEFNLPIIRVVIGKDGDKSPITKIEQVQEEEGKMINSEFLDGLDIHTAASKMMNYLEKKNWGKRVIRYHLRDWVFSRQHYWGEPTPMIKCPKCGWQPVLEKDLPVELPEVKKYQPTETGESPLAKVKDWINTKCPKCGGPSQRETDVMPNWAGSNWYYLAYTMPRNQKSKIKNQKYIWDKKKMGYWMPVDWYNGGMEHTTLHLLYSRFIYKFLWDIEAVPKLIGPEPYKKRTAHGIILGEGGIKMSKSKGNVINPDEVVKKYGADTLRIYEMFMGPFDEMIAWDTKGLKGAKRFLQKVWELFENPKSEITNSKLKRELHRTIKKVSEDIENLKFNTAVSSMMKFSNLWQENPNSLEVNDFENFLKILSPFAPHLSEELWQKLGKKESIFLEKFPKYDKKFIEEKKFLLIIQINGKVRDKIEIDIDIEKEEAEKIALSQEKIKKRIGDKKIKKTVFIANKLINFVI